MPQRSRRNPPCGCAYREVSRLIGADVLRDRREGNNRLVGANTEDPLWPFMSQIVAYGPAPLLRTLLAELPGIRAAYSYGSWAGRRAGHSREAEPLSTSA